VLPNEKIMILGEFNRIGNFVSRFAALVSENGKLDTSFKSPFDSLEIRILKPSNFGIWPSPGFYYCCSNAGLRNNLKNKLLIQIGI